MIIPATSCPGMSGALQRGHTITGACPQRQIHHPSVLSANLKAASALPVRFPSLEHHLDQQPQPGKIQLRDDPSFAATKMAAFQYAAVAIFLFLVTGFW